MRTTTFAGTLTCKVLSALLAVGTLSLSACGNGSSSEPVNNVTPGDSGNEVRNENQLSVGLTIAGNGAGSELTKFSGELVDMYGAWPQWDGQSSGITYDPRTNLLTLPAATNEREMVIGVKRFDVPLVAGARYDLSIYSENPNARVLLFPFDASGATPDGSPSFYAADASDSFLRFYAPSGVVGFYLQVQSSWNANATAPLRVGVWGDQDGRTSGTNLVGLAGLWTNWDGSAAQTTFEGGYVGLPAPAVSGESQVAVRRHDNAPLVAGARYVFSLVGRPRDMIALLFLFDDAGQLIPFQINGQEKPWLTTHPEGGRIFTMPAQARGFAVQIQSALSSTGAIEESPSYAQPLLRRADLPACATLLTDGGFENALTLNSNTLTQRTNQANSGDQAISWTDGWVSRGVSPRTIIGQRITFTAFAQGAGGEAGIDFFDSASQPKLIGVSSKVAPSADSFGPVSVSAIVPVGARWMSLWMHSAGSAVIDDMTLTVDGCQP